MLLTGFLGDLYFARLSSVLGLALSIAKNNRLEFLSIALGHL